MRRWYGFTRMQKRVARRLPSVLTVSGSSRDEIVERPRACARERIHVVPIGADTRLFSPDPAVPEVPGRIVTTSSADVPLKGLVYLVEALAKVRTEHPDAHLVVVGKRAEDGPVADAIDTVRPGRRRRASSRASRDAELVDLIRSAEVACVPSLYEGFSLPAAEAMATGTPLVATTGGAIPEVAGPRRRDLPRGAAGRRRRAGRGARPAARRRRGCAAGSARPDATGSWRASPGPRAAAGHRRALPRGDRARRAPGRAGRRPRPRAAAGAAAATAGAQSGPGRRMPRTTTQRRRDRRSRNVGSNH